MKKILVLGAGLVSRPLVRYLLDQPDFFVTVASRTVSKAVALINGHSDGRALPLNVKDDKKLEELIKDCDIAISLLPYPYHVKIAKLCIKHGKNLVTASYVSDAMAALDKPAKDAGVILLNEMGLDPGIDHMSAMKVIHDVENAGGKIVGFKSYCGGLPAPDANDNPYGYKFSWSPRGVLMAGKNDAHYMEDSIKFHIKGEDLFDNYWTLEVEPVGLFEGYPNRDSLPYVDTYGIKDTRTMLRGTLRNLKWCGNIKKFAELGMLDDTEDDKYKGLTYRKFMALMAGDPEVSDPKKAIAEKLGIGTISFEIKAMEWLGLFEDRKIPDGTPPNPMDILGGLMREKMKYKERERDMIVLHHIFDAEYPESDGKEQITATLVDYGIPGGDSSMARTVSLPAAISVKMILSGKIKEAGVHIPVKPEIYEPILKELESMGIKFEEKRKEIQ